MSDDLFNKIGLIETDGKKLETIYQLQKAFEQVKSNYASEYNNTSNDILETVKSRMKKNPYMAKAIQTFVNRYVLSSLRESATEELYGMLSAEIVQTLQTLSHTSCVII